MQLTRPSMPSEEANRYARVLQSQAKQYGFDPFSVVAIVHYETGWLPDVVSRDGEDHGLGQIRARYRGACRKDPDPLHHPTLACRQEKARLLNGEENLKEIARIIDANRKMCRKKTGTAWFKQWLSAYQGYAPKKKGNKRIYCQPGPKTFRVMNYRKYLIEKIIRKRNVRSPDAIALEAARKKAKAKRSRRRSRKRRR